MLQRIFANPEKKLKTLAAIVMLLFAALGVIVGISIGFASGSIILGILVMLMMVVIYGILGFLCGLFLYLYADVLETLKKNAKATKRSADALERIAAVMEGDAGALPQSTAASGTVDFDFESEE